MLIAVWISLDFKETGVISIAFNNVYIHWPSPAPGEITSRRSNHFAGLEKWRAHLSSWELPRNSQLHVPSAQEHLPTLLQAPAAAPTARYHQERTPNEGRGKRKEPDLKWKLHVQAAVVAVKVLLSGSTKHSNVCAHHAIDLLFPSKW